MQIVSQTDSLMLDQEMKVEFDSMSKICLDHLTSLEDEHGDSTKNMLNQAEDLKKDYQVNHQSILAKILKVAKQLVWVWVKMGKYGTCPVRLNQTKSSK